MTGQGTELLERTRELAALAAAAEAAVQGDGRVVIVQGPPGIGKTRLLGETSEIAQRAGAEVLRARGGALERDFAFGVARQLFEQPLAARGGAARNALMQGAAALAGPVVTVGDPSAAAPRGDRLFAVLHGLYWLSANLAAQRPLLIEVDDAHWADEQSLLWLAYLARRLADVPACVLLGVRVGEDTPASATLATIADEPLTETIEPAPLSVDAVAALLTGMVGIAPAPAFVDACHRRSAGNPFVVHELAAALQGTDIAPDHPDAADQLAGVLPDSVSRSVLARLQRLPGPAVALARSVAVLGSDAHLVDAARVADLGEVAAAKALDALVAAGFLLSAPELSFAHPLMREAIYSELPPGWRRHQHRRSAEVLAERIAPERIGAHLLECEPKGDPESVAVLRRCGARALARGAPSSAVRYLARALEEGPEPEARAPLLRELGGAEALVGSPDAVEHLRQALALAASPADIAAATRALGNAMGMRGQIADAVTTYESGIAALGGRDRELELRLEGELGALGQMDVAAAPRVGERLRRAAPGLAGATLGERLVLAGYAHLRSNELAPEEELADLALRALADGELLREQSADSSAYSLLMYVLYRAGRDELSEHWLAAAIADAQQRGSLVGMSIALAIRGHLRFLRGELSEAEADAQTSMDAQVEAGWASVLPIAAAVLADCRVERNDATAAMRLFEDRGLGGALPELAPFRWAQAARGRARIAAGHAPEGLADLLDCERDWMGARASIALLWRTDAALALAAQGNREEALRLAREHVALAREPGLAWQLGVGLRTLGLLTEGSEALALLEEAVAILARSSSRLEYARALVDHGAAVRRAGRRGDARDPLRAGYELARTCGSLVLLERAAEELAASGVRLRREALSGRDALTPSERRVADMAATGMSNPEIAQALFVTRKTIEMHLGHVYRKLDLSGREQLAAALAGEPAAAQAS